MNPTFLIRSALVAMVTAFVWGGMSSVLAADVSTAPPVVVGAAPVAVDPGCPTCEHGVAKSKCSKCGHLLSLHRNGKTPYPVTLCPGACFGYFQTQWRKWDDVCPYPYLGVGVTDAPRPPGGVLTPPRPLDPKMPDPKKTGDVPLPPIPVVQSKFTTPR